GDPAAGALEENLRSIVAVPITVDGKFWGFVTAASATDRPPPPTTEERLASFTELLGSAIADAEARSEVARLAHEQAALRRAATLVAKEASLGDVFATVAE